MLELVYALKDNKLVHIDDVPKGAACECICPSCKSPLIARKGNKKSHHFAHRSIDCKMGYESALHLLAKEILSESNEILLPALNINIENTVIDFELRHEGKIKYDTVKLETITENIIPDVIIEEKGRPLIIEIYVTHKVDDIKLNKIKELGISAIEIDLSNYVDILSKSELKELLLNEVHNKKWLYNKKAELVCKKIEANSIKRRAYQYKHDELLCPIGNIIEKGATWRKVANVFDDCHICEFFVNIIYDYDYNITVVCNIKMNCNDILENCFKCKDLTKCETKKTCDKIKSHYYY